MEAGETRLYGRRAFLGVTAVGLSSLVWGRAAWHASPAPRSRSPSAALGIIPSGWRIYTVACDRCRASTPSTWRLTIDGLVDRPQTIDYQQLRALSARGTGLDIPLRDGLDGARRPLARRALRETCSRRAAPVRGDACSRSPPPRQPYVDTLTLEQAQLPT